MANVDGWAIVAEGLELIEKTEKSTCIPNKFVVTDAGQWRSTAYKLLELLKQQARSPTPTKPSMHQGFGV